MSVVVASQYIADLIVALGLPDAGIVLGHREVNTQAGRRTDPTGVNLDDFRQLVHDALARRRQP
jgi:hypothetical protein